MQHLIFSPKSFIFHDMMLLIKHHIDIIHDFRQGVNRQSVPILWVISFSVFFSGAPVDFLAKSH